MNQVCPIFHNAVLPSVLLGAHLPYVGNAEGEAARVRDLHPVVTQQVQGAVSLAVELVPRSTALEEPVRPRLFTRDAQRVPGPAGRESESR